MYQNGQTECEYDNNWAESDDIKVLVISYSIEQ
jgi:hypothetical protein